MKIGLSAMRAGVNFGGWGDRTTASVKVAQLAERLGYDSIWTAEVAGTDAIVPLTWLAANTTTLQLGTAVLQMTARTPTMTAQTASTLDLMSNGRFILGLGPSGPIVVEGWHGVPYGKPVARTREYVEIIRKTMARSGPLHHEGEAYQLPYDGAGASGVGRATRLMFRPKRRRIPIYLAAMGPKSLTQAYEIADGVIPMFYNPEREEVFFEGVDRGSRSDDVELAPFVPVAVGDDLQRCRNRIKVGLAFFLGGMGAKNRNYYNQYFERLGYGDAAQMIADFYAAGHRPAAAMAVPDRFVDEVALCGPPERIRDRLDAWRESSVGTIILSGADVPSIRCIAELAL